MSDFVLAGLMVAFGVSGLIFALLLKLGKLKPGFHWAAGGFASPLGGSLMAIGFLGAGLSYLEDAFDQAAVLEYRFPILADVVIHIMMVVFLSGCGSSGEPTKPERPAQTSPKNELGQRIMEIPPAVLALIVIPVH